MEHLGEGPKSGSKAYKHGSNIGNFYLLPPLILQGLHIVHRLVLHLTHGFDVDYLIEKGFIFISNKEKLGPTYQDKNHFDFDAADDLTKLGDLLARLEFTI